MLGLERSQLQSQTQTGSLQPFSKSDPRDALPPAKLHFLKVLQLLHTAPLMGEHVFKHMSLREGFLIQTSTAHEKPDAGAHICNANSPTQRWEADTEQQLI